MTIIRYLFGMLIFFLLAGTVFADGLFGSDTLNASQVIITPADSSGTLLNISVLVHQPATSVSGTTSADMIAQWVRECAGEANRQDCIQRKSLEANALSRGYQFNLTSLENAHFTVYYFNPQGNVYRGLWVEVPGCINIIANHNATAYRPDSNGDMVPYTYYYAQCDISGVAISGVTDIRADFNPQPGQEISRSQEFYQYRNGSVTTSSEFAQDFRNFINGISTQDRQREIGAGGVLPCVGLFMIMGLLMASLYFAGKSPITLLDITTPKLPAPKGVTASGQILAPFGYTEMKRVTGDKMAAATGALTASAGILASRMRGDADLQRLRGMINAERGTAADRAASSGLGAPADVVQGRKISTALVTAGRSLGRRASELEALTRLPYHYGENEHRIVASIVEALERRGGKNALMAMTIRDYFLGQRTFQSLETLTAHPAIGQRSTMHYYLSNTLAKFYGVKRYALVGGLVMAGTDSAFRTARIVGRMGKAMVTEAPHLARATAKTTMEMIGGPRAMDALQARARTSPTAAWLTGQFQKHPSQVIIGTLFPINDKMAHLYKTLHNEAIRDEMRYVIRQLYRKMGLKFNVTEAELATMGHLDLDILKRSNYHASAELAVVEAEIRRILSSTAFSSQEKLAALSRLAESHGATIDHQMLAFSQRLQAIEASKEPEHMKLISLQQLFEEQNKLRMAAKGSGRVSEDAFFCHVGGDSLRGPQVWETMVLRTMIWDAENGFLRGGIEQELKSARLNIVNRLTTLDPTTAMEQLPEHMRNPAQLKAVTERNRIDLLSLFSNEGLQAFQKQHNKSMSSASISEIVNFMYGGSIARCTEIDKKTGRMTWRASDKELQLPANYTMVDVKRHWIDKLDSRENFAIGQWVESRFTRSYVPPYKASIEAELNRMPGSASWTIEQRTQMAKKAWVADQLLQDMEQRFNSHFGQNTYGTTHETNRFYLGILAGFMEKAMQDKRLDLNHPDMVFIRDKFDMTNTKHLARLKDLMHTYRAEYEAVLASQMSYDDIPKANKAVVMLHEGGFAFWKKGMMLSDSDRIMAGGAALRDEKGRLREFVPEDVVIKFGSRDDLQVQFNKVRSSKDPAEWHAFLDGAVKWAKEGGYSYEKEKVLAAVLWQYGQGTYDYERFWKQSAVTVEAKRNMTPAAPSMLRFFGADGHNLMPILSPWRDMMMHGGDYISKVALIAGGDVHRASYDITANSSQLRMHSFRLANKIQSGELMHGLTDEEQKAYRAVAAQHGAYCQVWQFAIDRNPWRMSSSFGTHQAWGSFFQFGPAIPYSVSTNLRAYMGRWEYANFMAHSGFAMDLAGKMFRPYVGMLRGMQMSMQGYATKWDQSPDPLRQWNYTPVRFGEAMQSLNPFSFTWAGGKFYDRMNKLNVIGGSLERHQLAGRDYFKGLGQAPQDIFLQKKGVAYTARTEDFNPGETIGTYRMEMRADATMAEYLFRTRAKDPTFMFDKGLYEDAMNTTTRRTVSAEALALRRDQELRAFGMMANPIIGWANPISFLWHMPVPLFPQSLTPKEIAAKYVARSKHGYGESFGAGMKKMAEDMTQSAAKFFQPHKIVNIVYCPKCGMSNVRGSACKNQGCRQAMY